MNLLTNLITEYSNISKKIKIFKQQTVIKNPKINLTNEDTYFPLNIKKYIINHTKWVVHYQDVGHNVCFYTYDKLVNVNEINHYYKKVLSVLYILKKYSTTSCGMLNLYIYLTPFKKELTNSKILNVNNVNTGFAGLCTYTNDVVIYRKEEWLKVMIHECIHYFGLDFAYMPTSIYKNRLSNIFCISSEYLLFESYTECMAELIYLCIYSIEHNLNINEMLRNEMKHSLYQTNKILKHIGCHYEDLLCENNKRKTIMIEKTNVFCYYILKTLYFFYLPDFLKWCSIHNDTLLSFNKTNNTILSFCNWIQEHYKRDGFINSLETISLKYKSEISNKSLRMNIYSDGL
jgi:hypothetical protein